MDDPAAAEQLRDLLNVPSAETRYGAFRRLLDRQPQRSADRGEQLGGQFSYHVLDTPRPADGPRHPSHRAEMVLFGRDQRFSTPAGRQRRQPDHDHQHRRPTKSPSASSPSEADQKRTVSTRVDDVIRAIVELGGTYPDVVQALQEAKAAGALPSRFEVEAVPGSIYAPVAGRTPKTKSSPSDNRPRCGQSRRRKC